MLERVLTEKAWVLAGLCLAMSATNWETALGIKHNCSDLWVWPAWWPAFDIERSLLVHDRPWVWPSGPALDTECSRLARDRPRVWPSKGLHSTQNAAAQRPLDECGGSLLSMCLRLNMSLLEMRSVIDGLALCLGKAFDEGMCARTALEVYKQFW